MELAQIIQNVSAQVQSMAKAGRSEVERVAGWGRTTHQFQGVVHGLTQRQGTGVNSAEMASNALVGREVAPEGLGNEKSFRHWSRRSRLVSGAKDDRSNTLLECAWRECRQRRLWSPKTAAFQGRSDADTTCRRRVCS